MRIDFHTHCFPDSLAARTMPRLAEVSATSPHTDGTLRALVDYMDAQGIDIAVLQHVATKPTQLDTINAYAASIQTNRVLCFGALHPGAADIPSAIENIRLKGLRGIKLHPAYQQFHVDDPSLATFYDTLAASGLPVLFHAGWDPVAPDTLYAPPRAFAQLAKAYPGMPIIAAHLGGMDCWEDVLRDLAGAPVYLDTSMITRCKRPEIIAQIIAAHDKERILFATDCPWGGVAQTDAYLKALHLDADVMAGIYWRNAARLLGIS